VSVAVVGAGIAGLVVAHTLKARGEEVLVVEAAPRVGGHIRSERSNGFLCEWGPNALLDREPAMRELIDALGLGDQVTHASAAAKRRWLWTGGRLTPLPMSPPEFLKSPVLPWTARLRFLMEPWLHGNRPSDDESVHDFAQRHFGERAADVLADAFQVGVFAGDARRLSLPAAFPQVAELERANPSLLKALAAQRKQRRAEGTPSEARGLFTFAEGIETLPKALAEKLGDALWTNARLTSLEWRPPGWKLGLRRPRGTLTVEAKKVVLALPSHAAAEVLSPLAPHLAETLASIPYAPIAAVHLGYARTDVSADLDGFGFLVPAAEQRSVLGVLYSSTIFPARAPEGHVLFTALVGGARQPELVALEDGALVDRVRADFAVALGITAAPRHASVVRVAKGIPQYELGHLARVRRVEQQLQAFPGLSVLGNAYGGVGVNDCVRTARALALSL
jgi:oxygen-dependent protoporphyrinogen oxidase